MADGLETVIEAAKLAFYDAIVVGGITNVELARHLGLTESIVRRFRDPLRASKMDKVEAALRAMVWRPGRQVRGAL